MLFAIQSLYEAKRQNHTFGRLVYTHTSSVGHSDGTHPQLVSYLWDITMMSVSGAVPSIPNKTLSGSIIAFFFFLFFFAVVVVVNDVVAGMAQ